MAEKGDPQGRWRRHHAFAKSRLNRNMIRAIVLLERLRDLLHEMAGFEFKELLDRWAEMQLPPYDENDPYHELYERITEDVAAASAGFIWVLDSYLATLNTEAVMNVRQMRRRDRADERRNGRR